MLQRTRRPTAGFMPSPAKAPPTGEDWLHEIKHDGFRILALRNAKALWAASWSWAEPDKALFQDFVAPLSASAFLR